MYWAWINSHISIPCEGWDWVGWMIFIGFRKVKVLSLQSEDWMIKSKILHKIWRLLTIWQYYGGMWYLNVCMKVFLCIYVDHFEQLSAPIMNFVQLSATFANALHIVLCQIVWCQIVLKSSKCSYIQTFKISNVPMFKC